MKTQLMKGNEAVILGALLAGCDCFFGYPITPASEIAEAAARYFPKLGRTFIHEPVLSNENSMHVLDYERATEVIKTASHRAIGVCYCRHKMTHLDRSCDAPLGICMTFDTVADSLIRHDIARKVDASECLALLDEARERRLVQFGENVQRSVSFICN